MRGVCTLNRDRAKCAILLMSFDVIGVLPSGTLCESVVLKNDCASVVVKVETCETSARMHVYAETVSCVEENRTTR